jgi:hypothetical protein
MPLTEDQVERFSIRELIDNWAVWRDSTDWDRFATVWHPEGQMWATWFQGSWQDFIKANREGFAKGVRILHFLGGTSIDLAMANKPHARAIAQTKMTINQRSVVHGVEVDVLCTGRFYDFLEKRDGKWGFVLRRLCYEKDRMDPVDPSARLELDRKILDEYPMGYRHLAYLQAQVGYPIKKDMPGLVGPETEALYAKGKGWLEGKPAL